MTTPRTFSVGIIGGLGPLAGAYFYLRLVELTPARKDQEHPRVVLISDPEVPSRVDHLAGRGLSPAPQLAKVARQLEADGVELIAIASATTHAYHQEIASAVAVPVLNVLREVGEEIRRGGFRRPGFAATTATATLRLFDAHLPPTATPLYPDHRTQAELMAVIDAVKGGDELGVLNARLTELLTRQWMKGADCIVLACTEMPLLRLTKPPLPIIDVTDLLARLVLRTFETATG